MKILSVSHSFHPESTGVGNVATSLVREWLAAGHDVSVVTSVPPPGVRASEEIARTKRFHCSGNLVRGMHGEIDGYRRYLMHLRPDIIVAHCAQVWCIDSLFSIADRLPCPVVLLSHGLSAYGSPEYAEYFAAVAPRRGPQASDRRPGRGRRESCMAENRRTTHGALRQHPHHNSRCRAIASVFCTLHPVTPTVICGPVFSIVCNAIGRTILSPFSWRRD